METTNAIVQQHWFDMPEVRRIDDAEGNPWWVAKDVCEYFGDTHYRRSVARLDEDEKGVTLIPTAGGPQKMTIVNEPGLYMLMFAMRPNKSRFKDERTARRVEQLDRFLIWICGEVVPSIRKHGGYMTPQKASEILEDPDALIELMQRLKVERAAQQSGRCEAPKEANPFAMFNFVHVAAELPQLAASEMVIDV